MYYLNLDSQPGPLASEKPSISIFTLNQRTILFGSVSLDFYQITCCHHSDKQVMHKTDTDAAAGTICTAELENKQWSSTDLIMSSVVMTDLGMQSAHAFLYASVKTSESVF